MREVIKINENTWRIEDEFVRFFLLTGTEKALLIDTGVNSPDAKELAESLTELPILLLNTHGDGDHTSGNAAFAEYYMHSDDYRNCGVAERTPDSTCKTIEDGMILELGNRPLQIFTMPGHTYGSVVVLDCNQRVLFSGDSVQTGGIFMFGEHRAPELLAASFEKIRAMKDRFDRIYPSHDTPDIPSDYVDKVAAAWKEVCEGKIKAQEINMFGNEVLQYSTEACGFLCGK